jgi:hypothetical protein
VQIGQRVELIGKTKQKEIDLVINGKYYKVLGIQLGKAFDDKDGPWLLLRGINPAHLKWVHETDDKNYIIKELQ